MSKKNTPTKPNTPTDDDLNLALELDLDSTADEVTADAVPSDTAGTVEDTEVQDAPNDEATESSRPGEIVSDSFGRPTVKRLAPTYGSDPAVKVKPRIPVKARTKQSHREVSSNPALLQFPTDRWGLTKDLKKAVTQLTSRIAGDPAKKELADAVFKVLMEHYEIRFKQDKAYKETLRAKHTSTAAE